ncbi:phosphatase PAP2 family protein [Candidatus Pacearchaeota archaeon]|nr:phosphatase PAP2 family protein [Candidatus Pacearchaeota archaeon]
MRSKKLVLYIVFFAALIILSFYLDARISTAFEKIRNLVLNDIFSGVTFVSTIIIFLFLTSLFLWKERKRKWIMPLWFTIFLSVVTSFLLKIAVQRQRPYILGIVSTPQFLQEAAHIVWDFSFPSFQAMLAFCAIPILKKEFPNFKYVWIVFACLVALSRVYFGLHFLSDVIVGGLIGYLLGVLIIKIEDENKFWERLYKIMFKRK